MQPWCVTSWKGVTERGRMDEIIPEYWNKQTNKPPTQPIRKPKPKKKHINKTPNPKKPHKQNPKPQQTSATGLSENLVVSLCTPAALLDLSRLQRSPHSTEKSRGRLRQRREGEQPLLGCSWALQIYRAQWEGTGFCPPGLKEALTVISIVCFQKLTHIPIFILNMSLCFQFLTVFWPNMSCVKGRIGSYHMRQRWKQTQYSFKNSPKFPKN